MRPKLVIRTGYKCVYHPMILVVVQNCYCGSVSVTIQLVPSSLTVILSVVKSQEKPKVLIKTKKQLVYTKKTFCQTHGG